MRRQSYFFCLRGSEAAILTTPPSRANIPGERFRSSRQQSCVLVSSSSRRSSLPRSKTRWSARDHRGGFHGASCRSCRIHSLFPERLSPQVPSWSCRDGGRRRHDGFLHRRDGAGCKGVAGTYKSRHVGDRRQFDSGQRRDVEGLAGGRPRLRRDAIQQARPDQRRKRQESRFGVVLQSRFLARRRGDPDRRRRHHVCQRSLERRPRHRCPHRQGHLDLRSRGVARERLQRLLRRREQGRGASQGQGLRGRL